MGKCYSAFSRFRAVFEPQDLGTSFHPSCTKPECLPKPPKTSLSDLFVLLISAVLIIRRSGWIIVREGIVWWR